ncbi:hypothetical protein CRUP_027349 [Coryphaenoides rupestris]|nr:hypothetical protein CRUP_027349 [Coryphaenoides rupestris]
MTSQQFPRHGMPVSAGVPQIPGVGNLVPTNQPKQQAGGDLEGGRDGDHAPQDHPSSGGGGALGFRDDKQDTVVVRPYPQVQTHGQPQVTAQPISIQPGAPVTGTPVTVHLPQGQPTALTEGQVKMKSPMPSRLIAPAPASNQAHLSGGPKVPGNLTVTMESSIAPTSSIPVATISGQQGHSSNLHQLMSGNIQIIRSGTPVQIGTSAVPPQTFTSHLPRGAAAAAVMSSSKTVLRPATGPSAGPGQPNVQHIIQQTIQTARVDHPPSPATSASSAAGCRATPPPASRCPSHRPWEASKPASSPTHDPEVHLPAPDAGSRGNRGSGSRRQHRDCHPLHHHGSAPHSQMTSNTIVTMTMATHSSHATAVTTSAIPVAKVVPQPIAHTSPPPVQPDYPGSGPNLIPIPSPPLVPTPVTHGGPERQQFQYFLPTYSSSPYHTYTPITSSVPTLRQYPVTPQAPSSALPAAGGVGVATTVHLNPMQLMTVDRLGLPTPQIGGQGLQPTPLTAQGLQPTPLGVQGLHPSASITTTQALQQAPGGNQQQQSDGKPGMVLADGFVASTICSTFGATQPATAATMTQGHAQAGGGVGGGAPTLASSPRPSILRKKPTNDGVKPKVEVHVAMAAPVMATVEALPSQQGAELQQLQQQQVVVSSQVPPTAGPPAPTSSSSSQPSAVLAAMMPANMAVTPPVPASMANVVASPTQPAASSTPAVPLCPDIKIKQEAEPMDTSHPVGGGIKLNKN